MSIHETVHNFINRHNLLEKGSRVLVAVSGGPDSLCLMGVMQDLQFDVRVAHFDHGLREGSSRDAAWVRDLAQACHMPVAIGNGDTRAYARSHKKTLEEGARRLRYEFLFLRAMEENTVAIATGHTRDDQAETVLMHLLRGAGPKGLAGMQPGQMLGDWLGETSKAPVRLIRPLLCLTRAQTEGYCQERGWQPLRDSSNQDTAFRRNRIRLELLPQLRSYNPRIVDVLCRLSEIMAAQTEYLDNEIQSKWMPAIRTVGPDELRIPRSIVREAPHAVRQGMIRLMISMLNPGLRDLAYRHVEQAIGFCLAPPETDHADLALGLEMAAEGEMIVFRKHRMEAGAMEWEGVTLPLPGKLHLRSPDMELEMEILPAGKVPLIQPRMSKWQACMDLDRLDLPLCVRSRRTGERWTPLGMEKTVNLANFLSAQHWPFSKRDHWPMVCDQTGIVWIPGVRMGEKARLKEKTERCLILHAKIVMEETS